MISKSSKRLTESRRAAEAATDAAFAAMDKRAAENLFAHRGFSAPTMHILVASGMQLPEEVLLLTNDQVAQIPGVDTAGRAEIEAYRKRFLPTDA